MLNNCGLKHTINKESNKVASEKICRVNARIKDN